MEPMTLIKEKYKIIYLLNYQELLDLTKFKENSNKKIKLALLNFNFILIFKRFNNF